MSRNKKSVLTKKEEELFLFDDEITQAIRERNEEEEKETSYEFSDMISSEGYIPTAR